MNRIVLGIVILTFVISATAVGGTAAFFSDIESSEGNVFTAGAIDLRIDNESYYNGDISDTTTWVRPADLDDLEGPGPNGTYLFFNFLDLKPGDEGEDTISIHVDTNEAYACMEMSLNEKLENGIIDPEAKQGDVSENLGELQFGINFMWWLDDGDNVFETHEVPIITSSLNNLDGFVVSLSDTSDASLLDEPLDPGTTYYLAKAWCFGELTLNPVDQNEGASPLHDPGVLCDGSLVENIAQTDSVGVTLAFSAVQARHNDGFVCDIEQIAAVPYSENFNNVNNADELEHWDFDWFGDGTAPNPIFDTDIVSDDAFEGTSLLLEDDVAGFVTIDTIGKENIVFSYQRRLVDGEGADMLRVGWKFGPATNDWNDYTELEATNNSSWALALWNLPASANDGSIGIAFYLDDGEGDFGLIDDVLVTGTDI